MRLETFTLGTQLPRSTQKQIRHYTHDAKDLYFNIHTKVENHKLIIKKSKDLVEQGIKIATDYALLHPACKDYLYTAIAHKEQMFQASPEDMEKLYHGDGALPKAPDKCYIPKDLIVHPATVFILATNPKNQHRMLEELAEVIDHIEELSTE